MTDVRFYHLSRKSLEQALPEILGKAYERGHRAVVMTSSDAQVESLNNLLWTYHPESFLPHGSIKNGHAPEQPIWLTVKDENPNSADLLVLIDGAASQNVKDYNLCCEIFDGTDEDAVKSARERWAGYKEQGYNLSYFQQNTKGSWEQKQ